MRAYEYSETELQCIESIVAPYSGDVPGSVWSLERKDLSDLKIKIKKHYLKEQNLTCAVCRQRIVVRHSAAWDLEHIVSRDENSDYCFESLNMCVTCKDCNLEKSDKKVLNQRRRGKYSTNTNHYKVVHSHFDTYNDHIEVIESGLLYKGKTDKGNCTIQIYGLKRFLYQKFIPECSSTALAENFLTVAKILSGGSESADHLVALVAIKYAIDNKIKSIIA